MLPGLLAPDSGNIRHFYPFANNDKTVSHPKLLSQLFSKMKKLLLTQVFPSLTFSLSICHEACLSAACTHHTLSKLRCLPILPNYPSSFPYLTLPAASKHPSRLPSTQRYLQYPSPLQSSSTFVSTTSLPLQN